MRIVHIQLNGMKEVRNLIGRRDFAINEIFAFASDGNLSSDGYFIELIVSYWTIGCISVIEYDSDGCLVDTGLALFIDELRKVSCSDL
jgi:hypothetical protein